LKIFSNTTPFIALASIGKLELLPQIFRQIHVAESVIAECTEGGRILVPDLRSLDWIVAVADETTSALPIIFELDRGEKQTLFLAKNMLLTGCSWMSGLAVVWQSILAFRLLAHWVCWLKQKRLA